MSEQKPAEHLWWQKGVIYQVYPRSFADNNRDGIGDLPGITAKLEYLAWLGVDALWLSPFYPSPMDDFGYDVSDYTGVDPIFGTLEDFDRLLNRAHQLGLKVIIDFVPNHSSDQHQWFKESRSGRDNSKRDWYFWRDPGPDGSPPNNWISVFGGSAWEWDVTTGQYYLHTFLKSQPDLNWRNPELKKAMFDALCFWLERGVDGFRIDVAHHILKDPELRDNPPRPEQTTYSYRPPRDYDSQLHLYDNNHSDIHQVYREMRQLLDSYSHFQPRVAIGEIHLLDPVERASYYGPNLDEIHLPFNFGLLFSPWDAVQFRQVVDRLEGALPPGAWPNYVLGNHDESRFASRHGLEAARVGMLLLLTLRGTPTIYYGDELGMRDVEIPPEKFQDGWAKQQPDIVVSRDPERTPMQWESSPNAGFTPEGVVPWLPVSPDCGEINVEREREEPGSMLNLTRNLLKLRRENAALETGSYQALETANPDCFCYLREAGKTRFLVCINFSPEQQLLTLSFPRPARLVLSTHKVIGQEKEVFLFASGSESKAETDNLSLNPYEGLILEFEA